MCGRYSLIADLGELARRFEFDGRHLSLEAAYNIAPTQEVLTVREDGEGRQAASCAGASSPPGPRTRQWRAA